MLERTVRVWEVSVGGHIHRSLIKEWLFSFGEGPQEGPSNLCKDKRGHQLAHRLTS